MSKFAIAGCLALGLASLLLSDATGQLPPQKGREKKGEAKAERPSALPPGQSESPEPDQVDKGLKLYKKVVMEVDGKTVTKLVPVTQIAPGDLKYKIGVSGYKSESGFVVWRTTKLVDKSMANKQRAPGEEVQLDLLGNGVIRKVSLERGDIILSIDGVEVTSADAITAAINWSATPSGPLSIEWIDFRSGNTYLGSIQPAKIKN